LILDEQKFHEATIADWPSRVVLLLYTHTPFPSSGVCRPALPLPAGLRVCRQRRVCRPRHIWGHLPRLCVPHTFLHGELEYIISQTVCEVLEVTDYFDQLSTRPEVTMLHLPVYLQPTIAGMFTCQIWHILETIFYQYWHILACQFWN